MTAQTGMTPTHNSTSNPTPPTAIPNSQPTPAPLAAPTAPDARDRDYVVQLGILRWARAGVVVNVLVIVMAGIAIGVGYVQYMENQRADHLKQCRELLTELLGNQSLEGQWQETFKTASDSNKFVHHYERLRDLEGSIKDRLTTSDYCQMAGFAAAVKGPAIAREYIEKARAKLAERDAPSDAVQYHRTRAALLMADYPAANVDELMDAYQKAVEHALRLEDGGLRRIALSKLYLQHGLACYMVGRREDGDKLIAKAKEVKVYHIGAEQTGHEEFIEFTADQARIAFGHQEGELGTADLYYAGYRSKKGPDGTIKWEVLKVFKPAVPVEKPVRTEK